MGRPAQRVLVAGGAIGRFGRFVDQPLTAIATPVVRDALAAVGLAASDIEAAFVGNAFGGALAGQGRFWRRCCWRPRVSPASRCAP